MTHPGLPAKSMNPHIIGLQVSFMPSNDGPVITILAVVDRKCLSFSSEAKVSFSSARNSNWILWTNLIPSFGRSGIVVNVAVINGIRLASFWDNVDIVTCPPLFGPLLMLDSPPETAHGNMLSTSPTIRPICRYFQHNLVSNKSPITRYLSSGADQANSHQVFPFI